MSSEWPTVTIDHVCDLIVDCVNKTAPVIDGPTPYRMIRTTNIRNGRIDLDECRFVDEATYAKWTRRAELRLGDVLLTREAPIGEVGFVLEPKGLFLGQRVMQYRANAQVLSHRFLLYSFLSPALQHQFGSHEGSGSVVSHIRVGDCFKFKLKLPPQPVQNEIAALLGALDDRIALLRETNATLEAIAQALFKSWFVDFDPVRAKSQAQAPAGMDEATAALFPDSFEESALGLLPKGWRVDPVGQVVEGIYDGPHATPPEADAGPVFLGIKNLTGSGLEFDDVRHIAERDFAQWTHRVMPQPGDIVFSYEATLGFFALIPPGLRCCLGRRLALIRPRVTSADGHFLLHQFIS
ncbi:MAG: restriction endonuclease subunit S, partial [Burkholderiales bacterium]|nr:restriction endonuclease subunit S [Burkholderiales bacterium]